MRKKDETLQALILDVARDMAEKEGIPALNIRAIAAKAGIASGTVYNYFSCKDEILLALTEEHWRQALAELKTTTTGQCFYEQLQQVYNVLSRNIRQSGGMLMESLGNVTADGRQRMQSMQLVLRNQLLAWIERDTAIQEAVWSETFTKEKYADFILMNLISLLKSKTCHILFLLEIVKRTLY